MKISDNKKALLIATIFILMGCTESILNWLGV